MPKVGADAGQVRHEDPLRLAVAARPSSRRRPPATRRLQPVHAHLERFHPRRPALIQRRVRLNGSRRAHLPAVRDDRARAGVRLDAVPETERQAPQTGCGTPAALQCPGVSGSLENEQPVSQDRAGRERPEEERTHHQKSLTGREARHGWTLVEEQHLLNHPSDFWV